MKPAYRAGALLLLFSGLATAASCDSNPTGPSNPPTEIACPVLGLGENHPQHPALQAVLERYVGATFPGMAAAVVTPDGVWVGAAGLADRRANVAMNTCHAFFSGSVAKTYTVTAAMRAVEDGLLALDDPIEAYLSPTLAQGLPNGTLATVRQLMNHSAGMPDHDNDAALDAYVESHNGRLPSAVEQLQYLFDEAPRFSPGSLAEYSSAHTLALSLVLDDASGAHHSDLVTRYIIDRLGLRNTWYKNEPGYPRPNHLVAGYVHDGSSLEDLTEAAVNYAEGSQGDAGLIATVHDYYLFLRGVMESEVVSSSSLSEMLEPFMLFEDSDHGFGYGLGLFIVKREGVVAKIGHSGSTLGGMTHLYYYPESESYIALATNVITEDAQSVLDWGGSLLLDLPEVSVMSELEAIVRQP